MIVDEDALLIDKIINGDGWAQAELFKKYNNSIYLTAKKYFYHPEDAAQEVWIKILDLIQNGKYKHCDNFIGYCKRICINYCLNFLSKEKKDPLNYSENIMYIIEQEFEKSENEEENLKYKFLADCLKEIKQVEPLNRLVLKRVEMWTDSQIADFYKKKANTVTQERNRVEKDLKKCIENKVKENNG